MRPLATRWSLAFLLGYIVVFFSELVFWHVDPFSIELLLTTFFYGAVIFFCLYCIERFHVRNIWALFIVGALFGWLTEGVIVQTIFYFFPLSLAFTALSWHALISFLFGLYFLRALLKREQPLHTIIVSIIIGIFWALWFMTWSVEGAADTPVGLFMEPTPFALFVFAATGWFILAQWLLGTLNKTTFTPTKTEVGIVTGFLFLQFLFVAVPAQPFTLFVLPPLFLLIFIALRKNKTNEKKSSIIPELYGAVSVKNLLLLLFIPLTATLLYGLLYNMGLQNHTELVEGIHGLVLVIPPLLVGTGMFIIGIYTLLFSKKPYKKR